MFSNICKLSGKSFVQMSSAMSRRKFSSARGTDFAHASRGEFLAKYLPYDKFVTPTICRQLKTKCDSSASLRVPPNPCCPIYPTPNHRKYKRLFLFGLLPSIVYQTLYALNVHEVIVYDCRDYEYMRRRAKRFPWGDGETSFFHNPHINYLPGECGDRSTETSTYRQQTFEVEYHHKITPDNRSLWNYLYTMLQFFF